MSRMADTRLASGRRSDAIGPGRLVLVVGPSGAGKDTLIEGARAACRTWSAIVFPRRMVTRPPSAAEINDAISPEDFERAVANGMFALSWDAHGHNYGIPASIDEDIRSGRTVVCNVSRTILADARRRYANVIVVLVTAPPEVLAERLKSRGRASDGDLAGRLRREVEIDRVCEPDIVIHNVNRPAAGVRRLLGAITAHGL